MRHLKRFNESKYENVEISVDEFDDMPDPLPISDRVFKTVSDFVSQWGAESKKEVIVIDEYPSEEIIQIEWNDPSKDGLDSNNLLLEISKTDDEWFWVYSGYWDSETHEYDEHYFKCDSIDGLLEKISELFSLYRITDQT